MPAGDDNEELAAEARAELGRAVTAYYSAVEPETYVDGWVLAAHKRSPGLEASSQTAVGIVTPDQPFVLTRGLLDIALTSERHRQLAER